MHNTHVSFRTDTDAVILQLIRDGNEKGYVLLYKHYWLPLNKYAYSLVEDTIVSEEIVQQLMVAIFDRQPVIRDHHALFPYLTRAVRNRSMNYLRDLRVHRRQLHALPAEGIQRGEHITGGLQWQDVMKMIRACLSPLPKQYSEVFFLNRVEQLTVREIAGLLRRPASTVEKQLSKAVQQVKAALAQKIH